MCNTLLFSSFSKYIFKKLTFHTPFQNNVVVLTLLQLKKKYCLFSTVLILFGIVWTVFSCNTLHFLAKQIKEKSTAQTSPISFCNFGIAITTIYFSFIDSKVTAILVNGGILPKLVMKLHREGSAPRHSKCPKLYTTLFWV